MKTLLLPLLVSSTTLFAQGLPGTGAMPKFPNPPMPGADKTIAPPVEKPPMDIDLAAAAVAGGAALPQASKTATPAPGLLAARFLGPDCVVFDGPVDGEIWAAGGNFKVHCRADGFRFLAAPAEANAAAAAIGFHLARAAVDGVALAIDDAAPERHGQRIEWPHGALIERLDVRHDGVEQSFVVADLPQRGELLLELRVDTAMRGEDLGDGIRFSGTAEIGYGEAVAIDAAGKRITAPTELRGDRLSIRVPAQFVAGATLPLLIDPWIASRTVRSDSLPIGETDMAWNESSLSWALVFQRRFAANDTDVYVQNLAQDLTPIGTLVPVDIGTAVWQHPAIANLTIDARFLVVAQVSDDDPAPYWISGRVLANDGFQLTNQFVIEKAGLAGHAIGDKLNPDVAGDPSPVGPTYFTVVWERAYSATDHDIHMKQVTFQGQLRAASPTMLANSTANQTRPSISKSDGPGPLAQVQHQRFAVVFQQTYGPADEDIHGCLLTWDGQIHQVNGQDTFPIATSWHNDVRPQVSSPTPEAGARQFLCVYERTTAGNGHIVASSFTSLGTVAGATVLSLLYPTLPTSWPQTRPSVDTDGCRFAVAFQYLHGGVGSDIDIGVFLLARTAAGLVLHDAAWIATTGSPEIEPAVASRYSSRGDFHREYAIAHALIGTTSHAVDVHRYWGHGSGGLQQRPTACGGLGITVQGIPAIGETLTFALGSNAPLTGVVAGVPVSVPIPICAGCTLGADGIAVIGNPYVLAIPLNTAFVGGTVAFQGFTFATGPCLGQIALSDTVDVTVR